MKNEKWKMKSGRLGGRRARTGARARCAAVAEARPPNIHQPASRLFHSHFCILHFSILVLSVCTDGLGVEGIPCLAF